MAEIAVRATPRAKRNRIEVRDGMIRVYVTAPPTDGLANRAVEELLAKTLGLAASKVHIVKGATTRDKVVEVQGSTYEEVLQQLAGQGNLYD
jgi:uncharacterized protein (TIGR00251 family)